MLLPVVLWLWLCASAFGYSASDNDFDNDPSVRKIPMKAFSLAPPYLDSDMSNRWFDFGGNTVIRSDRHIRLTGDHQSQQGWLFSRVPLSTTNWQVEFEFKIQGEGNLHGDGFALWLTKQRATPGPVFGSTDRFEGLGVFFDTYKNGRTGASFPYVMAMIGDGETTYDQEHDGKANELAGCSARGLRGYNGPTKARLTYFQDDYIALDLQYKSDETWTQCFRVGATSHTPIHLPPASYLGFSAETGELSDNHDILSIDTYSLYQSKPREPAGSNKNTGSKKERVVHDSEGGSWLWSFFKFILIVGVLAGAYVGFTVYRANQRGRF